MGHVRFVTKGEKSERDGMHIRGSNPRSEMGGFAVTDDTRRIRPSLRASRKATKMSSSALEDGVDAK
jgi:hypothetical protein